MAENLYLRAPGEKRRAPPGMSAVIHLDEPGSDGYPLHHNLDRLFITPFSPPPAVQGFLLAALGVWAADKLLPRGSQPDAWTREIVLHLPTTQEWAGLFPQLAPVLSFLSSDLWTLKARE